MLPKLPTVILPPVVTNMCRLAVTNSHNRLFTLLSYCFNAVLPSVVTWLTVSRYRDAIAAWCKMGALHFTFLCMLLHFSNCIFLVGMDDFCPCAQRYLYFKGHFNAAGSDPFCKWVEGWGIFTEQADRMSFLILIMREKCEGRKHGKGGVEGGKGAERGA